MFAVASSALCYLHQVSFAREACTGLPKHAAVCNKPWNCATQYTRMHFDPGNLMAMCKLQKPYRSAPGGVVGSLLDAIINSPRSKHANMIKIKDGQQAQALYHISLSIVNQAHSAKVS